MLDSKHGQPKLRQGNHPDWQTNSMPSTPINGPLQTCRELSIWQQRRVPPIGLYADRLNGIDFCYTRVLFTVQSSSSKAGHHLTLHRAVCATFSVPRALSCPVGGYLSPRHDEPRDVTASMYLLLCTVSASSLIFSLCLVNA